MITWAIIASAVSAGAIWLFVAQLKKSMKLSQQMQAKDRAHRREVSTLKDEIKKRDHIIKAIEEVNRETADKKRKVRSDDNPGRAATDIMRKLAGNSDGDDPPAGD